MYCYNYAKQRGKNMNNQDMPANPMFDNDANPCMIRLEGSNTKKAVEGETKFEKAFWQVYSAMLSDPAPFTNIDNPFINIDELAGYAINAVNAGFKALENRND